MTTKWMILLAAAALLALPAVAAAHDGHGHGHGRDRGEHARVRVRTAEKNAAFACKVERRQAGEDAFRDRWGTNRNRRNAFGKCVSSRGARGLHARLFEVATGLVTSAGAPNCQHTDAGCTVTATGGFSGLPIQRGTFTSSFTIDWVHASSNGAGGYCASATGTTTMVDSSNPGNTLVKTEQGRICEVGATGPSVEHVFYGRYEIDGVHSTGAYANAKGSGLAAFDQKTDGSIRGVELGGFAAAA